MRASTSTSCLGYLLCEQIDVGVNTDQGPKPHIPLSWVHAAGSAVLAFRTRNALLLHLHVMDGHFCRIDSGVEVTVSLSLALETNNQKE